MTRGYKGEVILDLLVGVDAAYENSTGSPVVCRRALDYLLGDLGYSVLPVGATLKVKIASAPFTGSIALRLNKKAHVVGLGVFGTYPALRYYLLDHDQLDLAPADSDGLLRFWVGLA